MCYGGLDPKYLLRDIEARMKTVAFERDTSEEPVPEPRIGVIARIGGIARRLLRKDAMHV